MTIHSQRDIERVRRLAREYAHEAQVFDSSYPSGPEILAIRALLSEPERDLQVALSAARSDYREHFHAQAARRGERAFEVTHDELGPITVSARDAGHACSVAAKAFGDGDAAKPYVVRDSRDGSTGSYRLANEVFSQLDHT